MTEPNTPIKVQPNQMWTYASNDPTGLAKRVDAVVTYPEKGMALVRVDDHWFEVSA